MATITAMTAEPLVQELLDQILELPDDAQEEIWQLLIDLRADEQDILGFDDRDRQPTP